MFDFDSPIDRFATDSIKWQGADGDQLAMGLADMDFRTAPPVIDALQRRVDHGVLGYTQAGPAFFDAVIGWTASRRGWSIEREWITPCPGIMPSMCHLLRAALDPGDGVVVQSPAFFPIPTAIEQNGLQVIDQPLQLTGARYRMNIEDFRTAAERPEVRAFVLCSPHNPLGRVWSRDELASIAEIAAANDVLVISDEIHAEIVFPWADFVSYGDVAPASSRFAILYGPSKGFNLPGLRTAVAVIPNAGLRAAFHDELHRVNEDFGINVMGATALEAAYRQGAEWLDALTAYLVGNLEAVQSGLAATVPGVEVITPDASFLLWLDFRALGLSDDELRTRIVDQAGVLIEPGISYGKNGSGFVRLNIGTQRDRLVDAIERMANVL